MKGYPVVVGDTKNGAALVGQVVSVSQSRAVVRRIDDRNFGVGAQLVQGADVRAAGHRRPGSRAATSCASR